ncbi:MULTISPECIES: DUF5133 domain-containing protein [Streptomyces]|nr:MULTISPECIES: DUF5133 domain-containing protein [Streptomyces]EGE40276.1 hypothetical protein SACT1_0904 [Streptomyces sp. ACT-1]SBU91754.1 hypothetical protein YW3DRAFT_01099 [Streptomyces sp. MnatMP-M77]SED69987.1 hypothetical protein SAMN04490359_1491 [Streptomyces griseus]SQA24424.1 Uncharacterised protein [Streptomyces griseus]
MAMEADPAILRELVNRYDELQSLDASHWDRTVRPGTEGTLYTLCVLTGIRDESKALAAARSSLPAPDLPQRSPRNPAS